MEAQCTFMSTSTMYIQIKPPKNALKGCANNRSLVAKDNIGEINI